MLTTTERQAVSELAHFLLQHERLDEAEHVLRGICRAAPEDPYGWYGLAIVAERRGELEAAAKLHTQ
ncbi:MAG TPA: tetratricopeptide repeat protein, partial [Gammaproteobacteria bacterium]|nr:tetratricopeptide repeat protein [Gammaproteobacteria bacterium]